MAAITKIYWIHTLTPLHVSRAASVSPVAREGVTKRPFISSTAVKGAWRHHFESMEKHGEDLLRAAFGCFDQPNESASAGSLVVSDAHILCLPIRSFSGTLAWVTSPLLLQRLPRHLLVAHVAEAIEALKPGEIVCCGIEEALLRDPITGNVHFQDLVFAPRECCVAGTLAEQIAARVFSDEPARQEEFRKKFAIVPDDTFDFLCKTATEVSAAGRIDRDNKVMTTGSLRYHECFPAETILVGIVQCDEVSSENRLSAEELMKHFCSKELTVYMGAQTGMARDHV
jgi:CRISPR-associated protein Cmr4